MSALRERDEFSKRLKQRLKERGIAPSASRLREIFNDRNPDLAISVQAARKWLEGGSIPRQPKLKALARMLEVAPEWLQYGQKAAEMTARQPQAEYGSALTDRELIRRYRRLRSDQQIALAAIITALSER